MNEKITREEVRHVADLARLELSDEEMARMTEQLNQILDYMDTLNELDTANIPPMTHAIEMRTVFRPDEAGEPLNRELTLSNAPRTDGASFVVPKVI